MNDCQPYFSFYLLQSAEEWKIVFYINGAIFLIGGTFYLLFSSGEKQPWASENGYEKLATDELFTEENH